MKKQVILSLVLFASVMLMNGCLTNPGGGTVYGDCPKYQCIKTMIEAPSNTEPIEISGKGPTLFAGTVHPEVKVINPNDEPANFKVVFTCKNLFKNTEETIEASEVWLQPGTSTIVQGDFKVGAKENWECSYSISASTINSCQLQPI